MDNQTQQEFLKDLEIDETKDAFYKPELELVAPEKVETEEEIEEKKKNRAFRRLEKKFEDSEKMQIALNERIKVLSEVGRFREEVGDDPLKEVEAIFGTDTPEKKAATDLLKKALSGMGEKAKAEAIAELEKKRESESQAVIKEEQTLDEIADHVEDEHGIDMSEDSPQRKGYFTLMQKMSPKDSDGNIKEYADPDAVAETFLALQKQQSSSRAKELSSRSMVQSGASQESKLQSSSLERELKEAGII